MSAVELISNIFTLPTLLALVIGTSVGLVMGVLPGLGGTMGIALLIPVTYTMEPGPAMIMLTALYTSAVYGGSITAILLHTPGTPASAATALDGYELTKRGEALRAVGMSTICSASGGLIGAVVLILVAPQLAKLSVMFNGPEFFLLALFGLTIIGSLAGKNVLKGLISGALGLCIALIGYDIMYGMPRFDFGITALQSGISVVPALIGLFSLSQILIQAERLIKKGGGGKPNLEIAEIKGRFLPSLKEYISLLPNIIRSSIIGVFIGILPGAGSDIGGWVSYNEAKRWSKHSDEFGKGSLEGICASETANNAVCGGALIPMMTLGIPGSSAAAVLMGGLMIHGMVPGNSLFTTYASTTYLVLFGYLISNILMAVIGGLTCKKIVNIVKVPNDVLSTIVIVLSILGAYAINSSIADSFIMVVFGIMGYFMRKFDFPTAPIVLALILGSMAEEGFMRALVMKKDVSLISYYLGRPICVVLFALIVFSVISIIFVNMLSNRRRKRQHVEIDHNND